MDKNSGVRLVAIGVAFVVLFSMIVTPKVVDSQVLPDIPRGDVLIVDALHGRLAVTDFNAWKPGVNLGNGIHQMLMDTLWYVDFTSGEWINALAAEKPTYNEDATQMTVDLREGIYWSDGVEFTADDVVYTVKVQMETPGFGYTSSFNTYVENVYAEDRHTVVFEFKESNLRFHYFFTVVIYDACSIMPKHIFEKAENPLSFTFNPPVSLTPYTLDSYDKAGYWWLFERRDDWERTSVGMLYGKPKPRYVLFISYGPDEKKAIAQIQHQLDCVFDLTPEAWEVLRGGNPYSEVWYEDFPWAWMDDGNARAMYFNLEKYPYNMTDVRWALALAINIEDVIISGFGGIERLAPFGCPTSAFTDDYIKPMKPWLENFTLSDGFKPFDSTIAESIREHFEHEGYDISLPPEEIWGVGWWKHTPQEAEKLLNNQGFTKRDGKWYLPNGKPWKIPILAPTFEIDAQRLAFAVADQWRKFGIECSIETKEAGPYWTRWPLGDFDVISSWGQGAAAGGTPDIGSLNFYQNLHKRYLVPTGEVASANQFRWENDAVSNALDEINRLPADDPRVIELAQDLFKEIVREMPYITMVINKKFNAHDNYVWTNFPSAENPYMAPVWWWSTFKFMLPSLESTGREPSEEH